VFNEDMGKYKVWLYRDMNGDSPVEKSFKRMNKSQQSKISKQILHLSEYGVSIHNNSLKKLSGTPLWEIRILGKDNIRLFCADTKYGVTVLHIFVKKSQKTRISDVSMAVKRLSTIS